MIMKNSINKYIGLALLLVSVSCADDKFAEFKTEKPESLIQYEYLNVYDALKSYVDRSANPNFKLGAGVGVNDFLQGEMVRSVAVANFDELTAGNAMKYSSCVSDKGVMDFSTVTKFVDAAKAAGLTIYGHTLAWHSQQNNKYLNSLIADKEIEIDPEDADNALHIHTDEAKDNPWDWELYYDLDQVLTVGQEYTLKVRMKASTPASFPFWPGMKDGSNTHYGAGNFSAGETWVDNVLVFTPESTIDRLRFCFGTFGGDLYFDDLTLVATGSEENLIVNSSFDDENDLSHWSKASWLSHTYVIEAIAAGPGTWFTNMITNGDAESSDVSCFFATEQVGGGPKAAAIGAAGTGADGVGHAFVVHSGDNPPEPHSTQFFVKADRALVIGDVCRLSFKYKADKDAGSDSQSHVNPGEYIFYNAGVSVNFTSEWQTFEKVFTVTSEMVTNEGIKPFQTIAWNLGVLKEANTYYFDDFKWEIEESGNKIPLTPEEKKDTLTWAMNNWIEGMMKACDGYVTTWDVVNEAISGGGDDGEGFYPLQSGSTASDEDKENNFYWQDYLGNEDYVRIAVAKAREHFAASGGNPADLKLFINDYNLESWWDDNKKAKSLIHWIEKWEADGVTKIDGIGTQMHVSYILNEADQKQQEESIVKMFQLLAATGKLIKISELDMGIVDRAFAEGYKTVNVTFEQQKKMAEFYQFIIQKYFEIIPVAQQYGITQWAMTDSPDVKGAWRRAEPIGLWGLDYNRKPTYEGFVNGLAGK